MKAMLQKGNNEEPKWLELPHCIFVYSGNHVEWAAFILMKNAVLVFSVEIYGNTPGHALFLSNSEIQITAQNTIAAYTFSFGMGIS